jgi:hypothetical protein
LALVAGLWQKLYPVWTRCYSILIVILSRAKDLLCWQAFEKSLEMPVKNLFLIASILFVLAAISLAQSAPTAPNQPFTVEYYYKAKWGYADEFLQLFKKNHYPVLKKEIEMGRLLKVWVDQPRYHTTEDGRWDYRVTIVFKNATVANEPFDEAALQRQLYPDQDTFKKEEQRRFEILLSHWDLPIKPVDVEGK